MNGWWSAMQLPKQLWNSFLTWRPRLRPKKDWLNNIIIMYFIMNFVDGIIRLTDSAKLKWILWCPLFRWAGRPGLKNLGVGEQHMALFLTCWVTWEKTWKTGCIEESFPNMSWSWILRFQTLKLLMSYSISAIKRSYSCSFSFTALSSNWFCWRTGPNFPGGWIASRIAAMPESSLTLWSPKHGDRIRHQSK